MDKEFDKNIKAYYIGTFNIKKSILDSIFVLKPKISILFGSYAKGDYKKESDIDLLFFDALKKQKIK